MLRSLPLALVLVTAPSQGLAGSDFDDLEKAFLGDHTSLEQELDALLKLEKKAAQSDQSDQADQSDQPGGANPTPKAAVEFSDPLSEFLAQEENRGSWEEVTVDQDELQIKRAAPKR